MTAAAGREAPKERTGAGGQRQPGNRAGLTSEKVLWAARELVTQDEGTPLTMRRLADHLGVAPNSLYSYYPNKAALMDAVLDLLLGDIEVPDPNETEWREGLLSIMDASREMLLGHTELLPLLFSRPIRGPNITRLGEAILKFLADGGVQGPQAVGALRALLIFTYGWVVIEAPRRADPDLAAREAVFRQAFASQSEHPMMSEQAEALSRRPEEETFRTSLQWLINGIIHETPKDTRPSDMTAQNCDIDRSAAGKG